MSARQVTFPKLNPGKLAVLTMFALGLAAAALAWWWNYAGSRRAMDFFGPEGALLVRTAPGVEILVVEPKESASQTPAEWITTASGQFAVLRRVDISRVPGLLNARTSLLADASFVSQPQGGAGPLATLEIVRFFDNDRQVLLAFEHQRGELYDLSRGRSVRLAAKTARGWQAFIARHLYRAAN